MATREDRPQTTVRVVSADKNIAVLQVGDDGTNTKTVRKGDVLTVFFTPPLEPVEPCCLSPNLDVHLPGCRFAGSDIELGGIAVAEEVFYSQQGREQCLLGFHAYTPWTPPHETTGVSLTWCARGCGFYQRSDHGS